MTRQQNRTIQEKNINIVEIEKYFTKNSWNLTSKPSQNQNKQHKAFLSKVLEQVGININRIQEKYRKVNSSLSNNVDYDTSTKQDKDKLQDFKTLIKELEKVKIENKFKIHAHLDTIRGIYVEENVNSNNTFITTVSEDCLVKTWILNQKNTKQNIQPISTYREHTGQLFALEGDNNTRDVDDMILFSGGSEQFVKVWYAPNRQKINGLSCVGLFMNDSKEHQEGSQTNQIVWQMKYKNKKLLTSASDGIVRLFDVGIQSHGSYQNLFSSSIRYLKDYKQKTCNYNVIQWIGSQGFIAGCSNAARITLWDIQRGKIMQKYEYEIQRPKDDKKKDLNYNSNYQTNSIKYHSESKMILAGCQDNTLRVFSYNEHKMIKKITAGIHDSISCVDIYRSNYIVGGCQDGSIKIWDRRTFRQLMDGVVHQNKYHQGVLCIKTTESGIYSGGADGVVNVFNI